MKKYLILLCTVICYSCTYDYDTGYNIEDFKPQVVVHSIISPQYPIKATLFWSKFYTVKGNLKKISNFNTELYEDNILVAEINNSDSVVVTDIYPKSGKRYRLEITVPDYGVVSAETYIPTPSDASGEFVKTKGWNYQHAKINGITPSEKFRAIWVRCYAYYENGYIDRSRNLYANNSFVDQINAGMDSYYAEDKGSNIGYEEFIRVPFQNISLATPIEFSARLEKEKSINIENTDDVALDEWGDPIISLDEWGDEIYYKNYKMDYMLVAVITPSDDYDKYFKTAYRQGLFDFSPDMPFAGGETVPVYCNVENGLGIFAGYSETSLKLKPKK